jgi:hypothetical protein
MENPTIQTSPTETLTAMIVDGKLGFEYKKLVDPTYDCKDGELKVKTKPVTKYIPLKPLVPAELCRTRPDDVKAFFAATVDLCVQTKTP